MPISLSPARCLCELSDLGALRRSASIEHFLGPAFRGERRGIDTCLAEPQARRKPPGPPSR